MRNYLSVMFLAVLIWTMYTNSQQPLQTTQAQSGSIAGYITIGGKPAAGVEVVLLKLDDKGSRRTQIASLKAEEDGRYRFTGVAPGDYDVSFSSTALIVPKQGRYGQPGRTVKVGSGEAVQSIDFNLIQGGVITGRITNADGVPVVGQTIKLNKTAERGFSQEFYPANHNSLKTNDQGVYRVEGVEPGHYLVSVGVSYGIPRSEGESGKIYKQTFYPGVTDQSKATTVEVKEGAVSGNIDIAVGNLLKTYMVTGRILDADGNPLPNVRLGIVSMREDGSVRTNGTGPWSSDSSGEFRIEGALPGHYQLVPQVDASSNSYGDSIDFDLRNENLSGIEIRMTRGATISGSVIVDGNKDSTLPDQLSDLGLSVFMPPPGRGMDGGSSRSRVNRDGSFKLSGLRPGKARIFLTSFSPKFSNEFTILRIEHNGAERQEGINVGPGEQITGVRITIGSGTGVIRGEVKIEGGQLEGVRLYVDYRHTKSTPNSYSVIEPDARGRFVIEKLVAGDYELLVGPMTVNVTGDAGGKTMGRMPTVKQTVSVKPGAESEVTLVLALTPRE